MLTVISQWVQKVSYLLCIPLFFSIALVDCYGNTEPAEGQHHNPQEKKVLEDRARKLIRLSPLGDFTNVYLYDFITESLRKSDMTREEARKIAEIEKKRTDPTEKPYWASVHESQLSHILNSLCQANDRCVAASVFNRAGLLHGIGLAREDLDLIKGIDQIYINDNVFNAFEDKTNKFPIAVTFPGGTPFSWKPTQKTISITYPVFFSEENNTAYLYRGSHAAREHDKLIGFVALVWEAKPEDPLFYDKNHPLK